MRVETIVELADWQALQPAWNTLVQASVSATTFLTWEWVSAWWTAYGNPDELCILTARDDAGALRGIAPLRRNTTRKYGQRYTTLDFLGDGSNDSDYLDFIAEKGFEAPVLEAFWERCQEEIGRGVLLRLNEMPAASPHFALLKNLAEPRHLWMERTVPCATIKLPASWDLYLSALKPRFRTKVRSVLRNLEARGDVRFGWCTSAEEAERLLPVLFDLHTRRWNHDGKPGVFGWDRKRRFYFDLSRQLLERRSLCFSWLEWNGRVLACQYGFLSGNTYLHLQEGYEPASEHWNVGIALRAWTIREFLAEGIREYDFLAGVGRHKMDWGAEVKESRQLVVASPSSRNLLYCRGPEWEDRAKESVKRLLPERVLALRKARLERQVSGAPRSGRELIRKAAARCYFELGAPAVAGLVHERYQLTVRPGGRPGRLSLTKRRQALGRIVYYHRVNDDNDPFFPSVATDVFERQMRFMARHYKMVSLRRLIEHLESGDPGTVFTITFDDGYRDNFENAFPILERYGIPATIFLTTGSLDSRDPLWFEVLAGAVKTTTREFLDREFDLPRRFWLRTEEERLRASGELFMQLRQMPDDGRQRELDSILCDLAAPEAGQRRDRMLTWDQVREMSPRGIDFGGHTVTHPFLSKLTPEQGAWEVGECKRRIEAELQAPVSHFAYPNGRDEDFSAWNQDTLKAAGYEAAVSTIWGLNDAATDRMALRRGGAWEEDEALFASKLDWYQLVNG
jgi:CelD/BcsL family acetyltransferase involved in cellulose biosynthesis/peptidoglycan/xylan/chitin deacetylase (PgdA/CDA1 family)